MIQQSKISMIDDAFSAYLKDSDERDLELKVGSTLKMFDHNKSYKIYIVDTYEMKKEPFFGMRVLPSQDFADSILKDFTQRSFTIRELLERWKNINSWVIEIDARVFDRRLLNFNPQELTAMILHEVGHIIYSDKPMEVFYRAYKEAYIRSKIEDKAKFKMMYRLYMIPLFFACGFRNWTVDEGTLREEIFADQSVKKFGYGQYLISAYQKIIRAYGNSNAIHTDTHKDVIANSIQFCNFNIIDLERRKERLKDELYFIGVRNHGIWIRNVIADIMKSLGITKKDKYNGNIVLESLSYNDFSGEEFLNQYSLIYTLEALNNVRRSLRIAENNAKSDIALEAFGKKKKKTQVPSQLDVDTILVEVDRIQSHADRRYVLDLIYCQEEKIEEFLQLCEENPVLANKYKLKMEGMLKELASMRQAVLNKKSFDAQYKVFVKYPVGYEG